MEEALLLKLLISHLDSDWFKITQEELESFTWERVAFNTH